MINTHQGRRERASIINWVNSDSYTHAITLNTDRELSIGNLSKIFSGFCHQFDKRVHRIRNMRRFPVDRRLHAIAFPENLATNAHLHGLADFTPALDVLGNEACLKQVVWQTWRRATRGAGSVKLKADPDSGWIVYCTKKYNGHFFLAADYRPH